MIDFEITKKQKILEVNNEMCHNYYYLIYGRLYNENRTKYKKFKYVLWFDIWDLLEYYEKDFVTNEEIKRYIEEIENPYLTYIENFGDIEKIKDFYKFCNDTINDYNNLISKR